MKAIIDHLERLSVSDPIEPELIQDIKIIAASAEEIGTFLNTLAKKKRRKGVLYLLDQHNVAKHLQQINNNIGGICQRIINYESLAESLWNVQILRPTAQPSLLDGEVEILIANLLSHEKRRFITSIVGAKGTGKTTLAKLIFSNEAVKAHFACRVWLSVFPRWKVKQFQREISKVAATLRTLEESEKYLLVVDGIQSSIFLDTLRETIRSIPDRSTGCRFLVTTRNANVARQAGTISFVYPLQLLDDEHSWILLKNNLGGVPLELEQMKVAKKVVAKCCGLRSEILKLKMSDLHLLSHRDVTSLGENPWSETFDTVYENLPSYLRRCLFYFELFPASFAIPARRLVVLWIAEDVVYNGKDQERPELVAEKYLTELIDLNLVQIAKRKPNGKVKTCRLPNALRQLFDSAPLQNYYKDVLSFKSFDTREGRAPGQDISNFLNMCISSNCLLLLRVLDLEDVYKPKLPKSIARLTLLRYLGLRWTYLESLPSSISSLLKLQTLDLKHTYIQILTSSIWQMELRHLYLSETFRTRFPSKPKAIGGNSLSDLQTLWGLFVDEETPVKGGLDKLSSIRKLGITCQSMLPQQEAMESQLDAVAEWIMRLEHLQFLRLRSRDEEGRPWKLKLKFLEGHVKLTDMYLLGWLSSPSILSLFPPSLVDLTLSHSKLDVDPMQILDHLPKLRSLSLLAESYLGRTLVCNPQSFPQLYVLKIWKLEGLEEWVIEKGALPSMRQLEIRSCPRMKMFPLGLKHVNSHLELKLTNMPKEITTNIDNILPHCDLHVHNFQ
uniref:Disease resistance RPP8-like protein 3 n=1 Tax=Cajanus cajan TaxID=3821 RepID=A0A151T0X3_CAJCA|nr:Disease resistance RPP8-like protein 3 [Cajanus cajan]